MSEQATIDAITTRIYEKADAKLKEDVRRRHQSFFNWFEPTQKQIEEIRKANNPFCIMMDMVFERERDQNREVAVSNFMRAVEVVSSEMQQ
jgi:hypothetical protein